VESASRPGVGFRARWGSPRLRARHNHRAGFPDRVRVSSTRGLTGPGRTLLCSVRHGCVLQAANSTSFSLRTGASAPPVRSELLWYRGRPRPAATPPPGFRLRPGPAAEKRPPAGRRGRGIPGPRPDSVPPRTSSRKTDGTECDGWRLAEGSAAGFRRTRPHQTPTRPSARRPNQSERTRGGGAGAAKRDQRAKPRGPPRRLGLPGRPDPPP